MPDFSAVWRIISVLAAAFSIAEISAEFPTAFSPLEQVPYIKLRSFPRSLSLRSAFFLSILRTTIRWRASFMLKHLIIFSTFDKQISRHTFRRLFLLSSSSSIKRALYNNHHSNFFIIYSASHRLLRRNQIIYTTTLSGLQNYAFSSALALHISRPQLLFLSERSEFPFSCTRTNGLCKIY